MNVAETTNRTGGSSAAATCQKPGVSEVYEKGLAFQTQLMKKKLSMKDKKEARDKARKEALTNERKAFIMARKEVRKAALEARKAERRAERKESKLGASKNIDMNKNDSSTDTDASLSSSPDPIVLKLQNRVAMKRQRQAEAKAIAQARKKELIEARNSFVAGRKAAIRAKRLAQSERKVSSRQASREARKSNFLVEIAEGVELVEKEQEVDDRSAQVALRQARMKKRIEERKAEKEALKESRKRIRREAKREKKVAAVAAQKDSIKADASKQGSNGHLDKVAEELKDLTLVGENVDGARMVETQASLTGTEDVCVAGVVKARKEEAMMKKKAKILALKAIDKALVTDSEPVMVENKFFVVKALNNRGTIKLEIAQKSSDEKENLVKGHDNVGTENVSVFENVADVETNPEGKFLEVNEVALIDTEHGRNEESNKEIVEKEKKHSAYGSDWEVVDVGNEAKRKREVRKQARRDLRKEARRELRKQKKDSKKLPKEAPANPDAANLSADTSDEWETVA